MSMTIVKADALSLLTKEGVELIPELNGTLKRALKELRRPHPEAEWVTEILSPVLFIKLPGAPARVIVTIENNQVVFTCSPGYLKFLVGYCTAMDIKFDIGGA